MRPITNQESINQLDLNQRNLYQLGVLLRSCKLIADTNNLNGLVNVVKSVGDNLSISGCFRIETEDDHKTMILGKGLSKKQCEGLSCQQCDKKVISEDNTILWRTADIVLIIDSTQMNEIEKGLLQDNMTILVDSIQSRIMTLRERYQTELNIVNERESLAKRMQQLLHCINRLNDHLINNHQYISETLICGLSAKFPVLGLEVDQEESILSLVEHSVEAQRAIIETQINSNKDLSQIISETINILAREISNSSVYRSNETIEVINSVELF